MKYLIIFIILFNSGINAFCGAQAESSRDQTMDLINKGTFVAQSYLDAESFLDEYHFDYEPDEEKSLSLYLDVDKPLVFFWGDYVTIQVSIITNYEEYYTSQPFAYVLCIDDSGLLKDKTNFNSILTAISNLLKIKTDNQKLYLFFQEEKQIKEFTINTGINEILQQFSEQLKSVKTKKILENLLIAGENLNLDMPVKYLWFIGKPIAESEKDLSALKFLISAYASTSTEISFCGYNESFRAQTVKSITQQFGGNSYYISEKDEFSEILIKDFKYYSKPAISDLVISVYNFGFTSANTSIRDYYQLSMGPDEHHTFLVNFGVPSLDLFHQQFLENLKGKGKNIEDEDINLPIIYPFAIITYEYFDYKEYKMQYGSEIVTVEFTEDYEEYRLAFNQNVIKNQAILHTVELLRNVASDLEHRNFENALLSIRKHIKLLEKINSQVNDPLIREDITTLKEYKALILEYINDPSKGSKIRLDLKKRRY